jgi:cell wall-associated NlpC family hydrolase
MFKQKKLLVCVPVFIMFLFLFSGLAYAEGNQSGTVTCDVLNVREQPSLDAKILFQLTQGTKTKVLENSGEWYKISYDDRTGWVFGEYLSVRDEAIGIGTINASNVNIRANPDLSAEILTRLNNGDKVSVFGRSGDWYKIGLSDKKKGWVYSKYLHVKDASISRGVVEDASVKAENTDASEKVNKIIEYAKKLLGVKYVYGGSSPKGFDCSGFVQYVFKNFGTKLERTAAGQSKHGEEVSKKNLKRGDLVFFDTNGGRNSIEHVGIYIGDGKFIHASSGRSTRKVVISDLTQGFYADTYMKARRYIK